MSQDASDVATSGHAAGFEAIALGTSLTVKDLQKSLTWYSEVFGFAIDQKYERDGQLRGAALNAGGVRILLNQDDGAKGWDRVKGQGLSFMFSTSQSIDEVANRIKAAGGTLDSEPADMPWGARVFGLSDPDGYKFAVSTPR
ncbi:MAG: VOC family protein [Phycisphaerae bacterium]|nr:VOC family protein [Gemmatimonadaceae bacterium]